MNDNNTPVFLQVFISYMLNIAGRSKTTVYQYNNDIKNFLKFLLAKRNIETQLIQMDKEFLKSITSADIFSYLLHLSLDKNLEAATRARRLCCIRTFFNYYTVKEPLLEKNPAKNIDSPGQKKKLPCFLSLEESKKLLETVKNCTGQNNVRDYAIITLFLNCGMRLSELVGINLQDISSDMEYITITGKGSKQRMLYLNSVCRKALGNYMKIRMTLETKDKNALFISRNRRRLYNNTVQKMMDKYFTMAGLSQRGYSTHKLRHTAATLMHRTGKVDVLVLKDILGHENLNTTQIYTHVSAQALKQALENNPLSNENEEKEKN